jgi:uncharacterized repeat protein (TIGR01451 family)
MSNYIPKFCYRQLGRLLAEPLPWRIAAAMIFFAPLSIASSAQALPAALPKDWCGRLWGIDSNTLQQIVWDNPTTGVTTTGLATNSGIANIGPIPDLPAGTSNATLGLHARSGTFYTIDRNTSKLYYYRMTSTGGGNWSSISTSIPVISGDSDSPEQVSTNFNKMTVTGDKLIIASANSLNVYTFPINPATGTLGSGVLSNPTFDGNTLLPDGSPGDPPGNDPDNVINGGDIAQDEYSDTYMLTYDNAGRTAPQYVYFYKLVSNQWVYKARATKAGYPNEQFGAFAIYNDTFYVKGSDGDLSKLNLTRVGNDYNWATTNSALSLVGTGTGVADMATCGVPAIAVTKIQQIYTDESAQTLTADQTRIGTGQYIKYTITGNNTGDAWARNSYIKDDLPPGITYIPNSATENGINLNAATYPFGSSANKPATSVGAPVGEIRLPFLGNSNITTYTYIVRVDGTAASIANQAKIGYTNPYPSDPPNCTTGVNCATSTLVSLYPSIFGTIWNDTNGSAAGTFSNIFTTGEAGTNTGTANTLYALLVNSTTNKVVLSKPVASDGKYAFQALNSNQNNLTIQLNTAPVAVGDPPPSLATIPVGWKATSPKITSPFNLATVDLLDRDFGIALPAGVILVKRITAINGQTTNDGKDLTAVVDPTTTTTTNDDATRKWPSGYLKGAIDAGTVRTGDTIEYTIYYLNDVGADAKNLKICDPIRGYQTYVANSMKMLPGGVIDLPANRIALTDLVDTNVDRANSYAAGVVNVPSGCNVGSSTVTGTDNGGVAIQITGSGATKQPDLLALLGATAAGAPTSSYGWFRFTTKVNP